MTRYPSKTAKKNPDKAISKVINYNSCPYMFMYVFIYSHTHISTHIKHQIANRMCSDSLPGEKAYLVLTEEHGECDEGKWIIRLQTTEKEECRNRAAAERSRMQYGDLAEMERHQTDLSHSAAQRATRIPRHSGTAGECFLEAVSI